MPKEIFEIRFHSRAGQGAKSAAHLIAEAALDEGKYMQSFPEYGPERAGAAMRAYVRISKKPIKTYATVENPDTIAVIDPSLLNKDIADGATKDSVLIVNTKECPDSIRKKTGFHGKIYTVDATGIALETLGNDYPNTAIIGAIVKVTEIINLKTITDRVKRFFLEKQKHEEAQTNTVAVKRGYLGVRE